MVNEFSIVHTQLNNAFTSHVNATCIHTLFSRQQFGMHDSMVRLLECAKSATAQLPIQRRITSFAGIGARLNVSSAMLTNWKSRGISKAGALQAERAFGCSAAWLLTGERSIKGSDHAPSVQTTGSRGRLSPEVLAALETLDQSGLDRVENLLRAHLDLPAPPTEERERSSRKQPQPRRA